MGGVMALRTKVDATTRRATAASIAVGAGGILLGFAMLDSALAPQSVTSPALSGLFVLSTLAWIAGPIFFARWLYAASQDTALLGGRPLRFSASQAVWSFFIPLVSLYRPYQALKDLHAASDPTSLPDIPRYEVRTGEGDYRSNARSVIDRQWKAKAFPVGAWWGAFLLHATSLNARGSAALELPWRLAFAAHALFDVASAVLAIMVIQSIVDRQRERLRRIEAAEEAQAVTA
jgi:hypothetical protein